MTTKFWPEIFSFNNKVCIVTGAGLIGYGIIIGLAEAGAKVIIGEIEEEKGKNLELQCKNDKLDVIFKKLDITNEESVDEFISFCLQKYERIDSWINTAYPRVGKWGDKKNLTNYDFFKKKILMLT